MMMTMTTATRNESATTTLTEDSSPSSLAHLLKLAPSFDKNSSNSNSNSNSTAIVSSSLTLKQLVPVYQSLLEVYHHQKNGNNGNNSREQRRGNLTAVFSLHDDDDGASSSANDLAQAILRLLPKEDGTVAQALFQHADNNNNNNNNDDDEKNLDRQRLLTWQFLLHHVWNHSSHCHEQDSILAMWQTLYHVLIPYLLSLEVNDGDPADDDAKVDVSMAMIAPPSPVLCAALLDVVETILVNVTIAIDDDNRNDHDHNEDEEEEYHHPESSSNNILMYRQAIFAMLVASNHYMASQILVRIMIALLQMADKTNNDHKKMSSSSSSLLLLNDTILLLADQAVQAYHDKVWNCIQVAATEGSSWNNSTVAVGRDWQQEHHQLASLSKHLLLPYMTYLMEMATTIMPKEDNHNTITNNSKNNAQGTKSNNMNPSGITNSKSINQNKLWQDPHRSHILKLWHRLLYWLQQENALQVLSWEEQRQDTSNTTILQRQKQQQTILLVATTVLCPLLPHLFPSHGNNLDTASLLQELDHDTINQSSSSSSSQLAVLWQLIYASLAQGRWSIRDPHTISAGSTNNHGIAGMLRRRALYLLDVLTSSSNFVDNSTTTTTTTISTSPPQLWKDYILCFETFEMESERHIVDQIWPVVVKLIRHATAVGLSESSSSSCSKTAVLVRGGGMLTPEWIQLLLGRLISSEHVAICKLGLFRLLQVLGRDITPADQIDAEAIIVEASAARNEPAATAGAGTSANTGNDVQDNGPKTNASINKQSKRNKKKMQKQEKQQQQQKGSKKPGGTNKTKNRKNSLEEIPTTLLIKMLPADVFLWDVLVPAFDTLGGSSVGYTMHMDENEQMLTNSGAAPKQLVKAHMVPMFMKMLQNYIAVENNNEFTKRSLWHGLWDWDRLLGNSMSKTILLVYRSAAEGLKSTGGTISMTNSDFIHIQSSFSKLFKTGSMVLTYRKDLLSILADIMASSRLPTSSLGNSGTTNLWSPMSMLSLLSLFTPSHFALDSTHWSMEQEVTLMTLSKWINQFQRQRPQQSDFAATAGATLASAFVAGQLSLDASSNSTSARVWSPLEGCSSNEQELGWAVTMFCSLAVVGSSTNSVSGLLWPAIHKGLSHTGAAVFASDHPNADSVARAILLLEYGCKLRFLSGMGHGDLVVDPRTQQIMPPPPNVEMMLQQSVDFITWHIRKLLSMDLHDESAGGTRSKGARRLAAIYASTIAQLKTLHQSYPSSPTLSIAMNELLESSFNELSKQQEHPDTSDDVQTIMLMGLVYAALSSLADPRKDLYLPMCRLVKKVALNGKSTNASKVWKQSARSMLQYSKWGSCSCLLPLLLKDLGNVSDKQLEEIKELVEELLHEGVDSVTLTPSDALRSLFDCVITTSRQWAKAAVKYESRQGEISYVKTLNNIVKALLMLLQESSISAQSAYFLNEICALIFQSKLMKEEFERLQNDSSCDTPIRDTFRKLIEMAGTKRPHISRAVLCRITVGWTGIEDDRKGLNAIPYRDEIVQLLLHKEDRQDEDATNQSKDELPAYDVRVLPENTNELSISRTFVLCFLDELPSPDGLDAMVKTELLHYMILQLLERAKPEEGNSPSLVMRGTPNYCAKLRAWQALVVLSRFVTDEIAIAVCTTVFQSLSEPIHSQIRYFIEVFIIQCALNHSDVFGKAFVDDISKTDLSLQHISSLMILGGNFILGKYQLRYFIEDADKARLRRVLASVIPWLSSTQGFSRAIAQLLVYALIPRVLEGSADNAASSLESNDWFLRVTYDFLDQNKEMKRLRSKQTKFFDDYNLGDMGLNYIMSIPIDEADEADPVHLIDAIKESLRQTYEEAHGDDVPVWKKFAEWKAEKDDGNDSDDDSDDEGNAAATVQRKIIPLDSLNLALEDLRELRLSNAAGTHKQPLIVCASLVDKVPNLGGLARTSEIFAAQSLIIPDMSVTNMDNFKSLSVGAADWIDIEEVKEENLLPWLLQKKAQGYWIVGLEQTSSSMPLQEIEMPHNTPTVLLLGKEKEGIPVRLLHAVDQCVEIPQFGMIRSLNVHVSGAIAIWEFTRQTRLR